MTELRFCKKKITGIPVGRESSFPALRDPIKTSFNSRLEDGDGLFVGYGMFTDSLPYAMQDEYDTTPKQPLELDSAVLENDYLLAEFVLDLGGRLWRLYDKVEKRELLTNNTEFLPRNLAIRNAWFAGGVEWNCGRRGHDADTCSPRFAAELQDPEYGPVLRIYDYNRDRRTPYQMDFFLPSDSRMLFSRVRIFNPNTEVVPMYWWSNIAAEQTPGARVVVPASDTYANQYDGGSHFVTRIPLPDGEGFDGTYPDRFDFIKDHFYNIPADSRKYESLIRPDGSGFVHMSTRRLQGRKLFVWGDTPGGHHWQRKLLAEGVADYIELQAGVAKTQMECIPMPPRTAWEWLEAYSAIHADPAKVFGEWNDAVREVSARVDALLPESTMDTMLAATKERIALKPGTVRHAGLGYAALEELRAGKKLSPQLDFGTTEEEQAEWVTLLKTGKLDDLPPKSYQVDMDYLPVLSAAPDCWKRSYHLALLYFRQKDHERMIRYSDDALKARRNAWTLHLSGCVKLMTEQDPSAGLALLAEAARTTEADAYLIKDVLKLLVQNGKYESAMEVYEALPEKHRIRPMAKLQYAFALAHTGKTDEAVAILSENGGLELPDAREGIGDITDLYIQLKKQQGVPEDQIEIPSAIDYRIRKPQGK